MATSALLCQQRNTLARATTLDVDASSSQKFSYKARHPTPPHHDRLQNIRQKRHFLQAEGLSAGVIGAFWGRHYSTDLNSEISESIALSVNCFPAHGEENRK
jgi:hypothetical protein